MAERILITANDIKDLQLTLLWLKTRPSIELFEALEDFTAALSFAPLTSHLIPYYDRQIYFSVVKVARIKLRNALNGETIRNLEELIARLTYRIEQLKEQVKAESKYNNIS